MEITKTVLIEYKEEKEREISTLGVEKSKELEQAAERVKQFETDLFAEVNTKYLNKTNEVRSQIDLLDKLIVKSEEI